MRRAIIRTAVAVRAAEKEQKRRRTCFVKWRRRFEVIYMQEEGTLRRSTIDGLKQCYQSVENMTCRHVCQGNVTTLRLQYSVQCAQFCQNKNRFSLAFTTCISSQSDSGSLHVIVAKLVRYILVRSVQERMHGPLALMFQDKLLLPFAFQDEMIRLFAFALAL